MFSGRSIAGYSFLTIIYAATIAPFLYVASLNLAQNPQLMREGDPGRNERSTPRTFVLPSSPAVALEQERKLALVHQSGMISYCMTRLQELGYYEGSIDDIFDIHLFIAALRFQAELEIPKTGELDALTRGALDC